MIDKRVLHITYWYPNPKNDQEALWVKRQVLSLSPFVKDYYILHLEVKAGRRFKVQKYQEEKLLQRIIEFPTHSWFLIEQLNFGLLLYYLIKLQVNEKFDILNFHIAYPMLTYWHLIKKFVRKPILISEHWSAYHFNFGVQKKLPRIQRIFRQGLPVMAVSNSLVKDIKDFSGAVFPSYIVPNVVNDKIFYPDPSVNREDFFFMVSQWKYPKDPIIIMKSFISLHKEITDYKLVIGGYGPEWIKMEKWIIKNNAEDAIKMVGKLTEQEVAQYMRKCRAFIHPSEYETFSVVCAEAISCGTPVVALKVGGIPEVVNGNGILLGSKEEWEVALRKVMQLKVHNYENQFDQKSVGMKYSEVLQEVINDFKK